MAFVFVRPSKIWSLSAGDEICAEPINLQRKLLVCTGPGEMHGIRQILSASSATQREAKSTLLLLDKLTSLRRKLLRLCSVKYVPVHLNS